MSNYTYWLHAFVSVADLAKGDALGGILGPCSDDDQMYSRGVSLYPAGTTFTPVQDGPITRYQASASPSHKAVSLAIKSTLARSIEQFRDGQMPDALVGRMTPEQVAVYRAALTLEFGPRASLEGGLRQFIEAHGLTMAP